MLWEALTMLLRRYFGNIMALKLMFGVLELFCTSYSVVFHRSGQV